MPVNHLTGYLTLPLLFHLELVPQPKVNGKLVRPIHIVAGDHIMGPHVSLVGVVPQISQPVHLTMGVVGQGVINHQSPGTRAHRAPPQPDEFPLHSSPVKLLLIPDGWGQELVEGALVIAL